tara:strand:- start:6723 stop:8111 length:1389 start_codon:yes stop_codon:yes gene_type:complete
MIVPRTRPKNKSIWFRLLTVSVIWTVFVLLVGGYILSLTFRGIIEKNLDDRLAGFLDNLVGISHAEFQEDVSFYRALSDPRFEQPYSGWYWQISARGYTPFRSRSLWDQSLNPDLETPRPRPIYYDAIGPEDQLIRVIEQDISMPGTEVTFRYSVAIDKSEIEAQAKDFNRILIWSLGILGAGLILASVFQLVYGLQPLRRIQTLLAQIRSGAQKRLPDNLPSEIQPMADELNALLEHHEEVIARSRTQVGNLAHALKTPLAVLMNEAELQKDVGLAGLVTRQAELMRRQIDHYLRRARVAASIKVIGSRTEVAPVVRDIARAMSIIYKNRRINVTIQGDEKRLLFRGEKQDLEEIVGNLVENAAKWAQEQIEVTVCRKGDRILLQVADDGPGISRSEREAVFARGEKLDENKPGAGLGLSIVRDLVDLYDGSITLEDHFSVKEKSGNRGLLVKISLAAAFS